MEGVADLNEGGAGEVVVRKKVKEEKVIERVLGAGVTGREDGVDQEACDGGVGVNPSRSPISPKTGRAPSARVFYTSRITSADGYSVKVLVE